MKIPDLGESKAVLAKSAMLAPLCLFLAAIVIAGVRDIGSASTGSGQDALTVSAVDLLPAGASDQMARPVNAELELSERLAAEHAIKENAERPDTKLPVPSASPFVLAEADLANRLRAVNCLAAAVYYEAASESNDGQMAVAQVVLNRLRSPLYPRSICEVVFQGANLATGCQFSFTCDGSMQRLPSVAGWRRARAVANAALSGQVNSQVGWATNYHADYVAPYWAANLVKLKSIGRHIFYGLPGYWNRPTAFNQTYLGAENGLPIAAGENAVDAVLQASAQGSNAAARVISMSERPVIFAEPAKRTDSVGAAPASSERRWVLGAPTVADQPDEAPKLPL